MQEDQLIHNLRAAGLRPTAVRLLLLNVLCESSGFRDAEAIYRDLKERGTPIGISAVYRMLREMREAGMLLCIRGDAQRSAHYRLKSGASAFSIICHGNREKATFSDPELHTRILSAAERAGLDLTGREFDLHIHFRPRSADCNERSPPARRVV
ncbi:MAG: transcriptional repressor [Azoarcus sp.]|jgi:Fur family ferric uptake transcriptional regulator|nr:transcriptional repressor [Azoarcus sp.]